MNFKHSKGYTQVKDEKKPLENNGIKWDLPQISGQSLTDVGFLPVLGSKTSILFWWSGGIFCDIRPSVQKGLSIHHRVDETVVYSAIVPRQFIVTNQPRSPQTVVQ